MSLWVWFWPVDADDADFQLLALGFTVATIFRTTTPSNLSRDCMSTGTEYREQSVNMAWAPTSGQFRWRTCQSICW